MNSQAPFLVLFVLFCGMTVPFLADNNNKLICLLSTKKDTGWCLMLFYVYASLEQSVKFCVNLIDYSTEVFGLVGKVKVVDINN